MTYCDNKVSAPIAVAALFLSFATPHWAIAQGVNSLPDGPVACGAFQRSGYGSWTVLRPAAVYPNGVAVNLMPGETFAPNQLFDGYEMTAILDRNCGNP
jgi:hypothetical protein